MKATNATPKIGFTCAYTPLAIIEAAGFAPYRVLPLGNAADQAGQWIHDNLCPHVKRILDRALADDLPELAGMVIVNSCDTMRRLADAWHHIRPHDPLLLLDLPTTTDERAVDFFTSEITGMAHALAQWGRIAFSRDDLIKSLKIYNDISKLLIQARHVAGATPALNGGAKLQRLYNRISTSSFSDSLESVQKFLEGFLSSATPADLADSSDFSDFMPIFLFGNVFPDPEAFQLLAASGAHIAGDDLCTGSRLFSAIDFQPDEDPFNTLARSLLVKPPCARTFNPLESFQLPNKILEGASACNARGVIGYFMKFCDPYLARLPLIQETLQKAKMPLLVLEGDLSLGSIGQQRTRIEAFIEMLK